jgi:hypothetical protein|tara:strand:+ start:3409 stop:3543 length:135 start_codon:yes stop_codon:yes gene_type:complete
MPVRQVFNKKIGAWVKFEFTKQGTKFTDVKQKLPKVPFKGVSKT